MTTFQNNRASFASSTSALRTIPYSLTQGDTRDVDFASRSQQNATFPVEDPSYLSSQLKSAEWLQRYGLKSQKLTFDQILQQIGYKRLETYVSSIGKSVGAKYTGDQYHEIQHDNGDHYILTCRPEKLREFKTHLERLLALLRKRLTFITSGSRRVFGILGEPSICFVCDCKTTDHRRFNQVQSAITSLLREQVSKIKRFNIIWVSNDKEQFQERPVDVTPSVIDQAIDWINTRTCPRNKVSISATSEAILKAFTNSVHSIYLISEGESSDSAREILRDNIVKTRLSSNTPIPIHVVSLFCQNPDTETFLRSIAQTADGSFISYKIQNEKSELKPLSNSSDPTVIKIQENTLRFGTNISLSKPEQPTDLLLMYKEINQCHSIIDRLDKILGFVRDENENALQTINNTKSLEPFNRTNKTSNNLQRSLIIESSELFHNDESEMASIDWLKIYGIDAQKLDVASVLHPAAFRHCDGVITSMKPPEDANGKYNKTSASTKPKLINAKYCDQFAHLAWPDGTIRHVFVTTDMHRDYERRLRALLEKIKARLAWLKKGSRDLFGTIVEKNIYILIDTSVSMKNHLDYVKDKLRLLVQDQLFSKERINMVAFNTITNPWRERLAKVNDPNTTSQLQPWIDGLCAEGSTNTLAALRFALADPVTEAIYLLTDGRPDQNERHVLSQVQYRQKVPIHTIAFNCQDQIANQFLIDLSKQTGGRFHAFNYGLDNVLSPETPESEDVRYLKQELARSEKDLKRIADLRDECTGRAWTLNNIQAKYKAPRINELSAAVPVRSQSSLDTISRPIVSATMPQRIDRRKCSSVLARRKEKSKSTTQIIGRTSRLYLNPDQWVLPETDEYLRENDKHQNHASTVDNRKQEGDLTERIPTPYDEVKSYLKTNSLVSKRLTIFDVLYPTSVTVKQPPQVQVVDRYVLAKVWDDILPLAHGSRANKLRLVSHYANDLERYEMELKDLTADYRRFIARFIWKCLNDEQKKELAPGLYWITSPQEKQDTLARELTEAESSNQKRPLELFAWEKLSSDEQNKFLQKTPIYHEKTQEILKNALRNAEAGSALEGIALMDVEIKRAEKFLQISTTIRQYQKRTHDESKQKVEQKPIPKRPSSNNRNLGQRVLCRYDPDGYFYPGSLNKNQDGRTIVFFDMDIEQDATGHILLPMNKLNNNTSLFLNDRVLVRQINETEEYWAPGSVRGLQSPFTLPPNLYMIQLHNPFPNQVYVHRKDLVRINETLYQRSVVYLQKLNRLSVTNDFPVDHEPDSSDPESVSASEFEKTLNRLLVPIKERIDRFDKVYRKRYQTLHMTLIDQMTVIRILQEQSNKRLVKNDSTQTHERRPSSTSPTPRGPVVNSRTPPGPVVNPPTPPVTPVIPSTPPGPDLESIEPGTQVYAVWSDDDGLVYESIIIKVIDSIYYTVERAELRGIRSKISRENIFLRLDRRILKDITTESFVLIQYPKDSRRYLCPAVILHHDKSTTQVRFYDCLSRSIDSNQAVIPISKQQFKQYTGLRIEKEKALVNQVTVGFNKDTRTFMLGTIKKRIHDGHTYTIEWFNNTTGEQTDEHLFPGVFTRYHSHQTGNLVLAVDDDDMLYKPARIVSISNHRETLTVEYLDSRQTTENLTRRQAEVQATSTFIISEAYYNELIRLQHSRH